MPGAPSRSPTLDIPRLRDAFGGRVVAPGDPGYDQARKVFYGKWDRRPAVVVRPADAHEVTRLHELAGIVGGMLVLPADAGVIEGFMAAAAAAPEELSAIANIMVARRCRSCPPRPTAS